MKYIPRRIAKVIQEVSNEYACLLITGPRQVGKSTLLNQLSDDSRKRITLDDLQMRKLAKEDPELFLQLNTAPVIIDEVQYAPELFSYIKMAIDNGAPSGSYWLTGSQSFKLMELAQESLAGRIALLSLSSLSQNEIDEQIDFEPFKVSIEDIQERAKKMQPYLIHELFEKIWKGSMPAFVSGKYTNRDIFYSGYLKTYIARDIREELNLKDDIKFLDFIRAAACRTGQMLNIHSIASDVEISDDTAKRWLNILEKSDIIYYLYPYANNLLKRTIKAPKLYFFDTGLVAYLTKYSNSEILQNGSINGAILENYVVSEIRKSYLNCGKEPYLYYFRDKQNNEIDLIIESDGLVYPIEIKKTSNPTESMVKAFEILRKQKISMGQGAIICTKNEVTALNRDIFVVPIWSI